MVADWILIWLLFLTPKAIFDQGHEVAADDRRVSDRDCLQPRPTNQAGLNSLPPIAIHQRLGPG